MQRPAPPRNYATTDEEEELLLAMAISASLAEKGGPGKGRFDCMGWAARGDAQGPSRLCHLHPLPSCWPWCSFRHATAHLDTQGTLLAAHPSLPHLHLPKQVRAQGQARAHQQQRLQLSPGTHPSSQQPQASSPLPPPQAGCQQQGHPQAGCKQQGHQQPTARPGCLRLL